MGKTVERGRAVVAHTRPVELDVNRLRRLSLGPRVLVQLDQSTLSELALGNSHAATRELLMAGVQAGKLVCPKSLGATARHL